MPSSLIFAGLVATWLVVFIPMTARRRKQMTRPSDTAMSSRVLERPVRTRPAGTGPGSEEGGESMEGQAASDARYRPGRGGYDPEAAELAARARYTFRQRMVLGLVLLAVVSALVAVGLTVPEAWYVHAGADVVLVAYLINLRRQVRSENAIRARRAARLAGSRSGRGAAHSDQYGDEYEDGGEHEGLDDYLDSTPRLITDEDRWPRYSGPDDGGHGLGPDAEFHGGERPALPRLKPVPFPLRPFGTEALELDDEDPELHDLGYAEPWGYRRAAGQ